MPPLGRKRVLAYGGLLEVHLGACRQAIVDFMFAGIAVVDQCLLHYKFGIGSASAMARSNPAVGTWTPAREEDTHQTLRRTISLPRGV
jgi:hypothetical protein